MCGNCGYNGEEPYYPLPARRRSYRRTMKPMPPRKRSAAARISVNTFWNQLEEFQDRLAATRTPPAVPVDVAPEDQHDLDTLECDREVEAVFVHSDGGQRWYVEEEAEEELMPEEGDVGESSVSSSSSCYCTACSSTPSPVLAARTRRAKPATPALLERDPVHQDEEALPPLVAPPAYGRQSRQSALVGQRVHAFPAAGSPLPPLVRIMPLPPSHVLTRERFPPAPATTRDSFPPPPAIMLEKMPLPPTMHQTRALIGLMDRMDCFRLSTAV